jgi:hypothetical protein
VELIGSFFFWHCFGTDTLMLHSQMFPSYVSREQVVSKDGALAKLMERRLLRQLQNTAPL